MKNQPQLMQRQSTSRFAPVRRSQVMMGEDGFVNARGLIALCAVACFIVTGTLLAFFDSEAPTQVSHPASAGLTFAKRVVYQRAIEEVYWRHRIWPKERPDVKPSLDAVMPQAQVEKKVADYLRKSQALEDYWQRPITADQLQAEMDRMAKHTKQPEVLRELLEALGNDPFIIAECLARPALAERLLTSWYAYDQGIHGELRPRAGSSEASAENQPPKIVTAASAKYILPFISDTATGCTPDTWTATSTTNAPAARFGHTAVWTGSEMIIWGGQDDNLQYLNTGGRYNPSTDSWAATNTTTAPDGRGGHTAVWTGSEMIVWGGVTDNSYANTGGRYNPGTDSWTSVNTANAPSERAGHTAVWTGNEMIVWGGRDFLTYFDTGGRYNPGTDSWTTTSATDAPAGRYVHTAVWTGNEMIIWGGTDDTSVFNTGGRYNPGTDSWTGVNTANAPSDRYYQTAVWTGSEMIVWGGYNGSVLNSGGRYNPGTDSWTATSTTNAAAARYIHTAVWTGSEMIVWGGIGTGLLNTGGKYNPGMDSWTATSTMNAPSARYYHTGVWTNTEMIVWGGEDGVNLLNTGGRYCGESGGPTPTPTPTATPTPTPCTGRCTPTPRPRPTPHPRP